MLVADSLDSFPRSGKPVYLTIGNFDGVHQGHQALLQHLKETASANGGFSAALTYSNHPSSVLEPKRQTPLLCTISHKVKLLQEAGLSMTILVPFTEAFSQQSPETFLNKLKKSMPLKKLILGSDAHIGKDRQGDKETVSRLAAALGIEIEYFSDYLWHGERISSSRIREQLQKGNLNAVAELLGRPYGIHSIVIRGEGKGKSIGFPTANIDVHGLCLPPQGVYVVSLRHGEAVFEGIANLGVAPTLKNQPTPLLEVHLFDGRHQLYGEAVEVVFHQFIRAEKQFLNVNDLSAQIALDIAQAKLIHSRHRSL